MAEPNHEGNQGAAQTSSPYRPGFNQSPMVLAGRDDILAAADEAIVTATLDHRMPPPLLVVGPRGVGKTVLLGEIAGRAGTTYGWPRLHVEVGPNQPFTPALARDAAALTSVFADAPSGRRFRASEAVLRAQVAGVGGEIKFARDQLDPVAPLELRTILTKLAEAAANSQSGFVLTLDELQLTERDELSQLAAVLQLAAGEEWPIVVAGAGLAGMRDPSRAVSYFERADWYDIGTLNEAETLLALKGPAASAGRPLDGDAAEYLARCTGGYPYAIQLYGHHAWRASTGQDHIDLAAAQSAENTAGAQLERGLYASRWAQTPERERRYLAVAADLVAAGKVVTGGVVAAEMGTTAQRLSTARDRLIRRGTLTSEGEVLRFAVPGMASYVQRQFQVEYGADAAAVTRTAAQNLNAVKARRPRGHDFGR